jgi:hypothetical protein
VNAADAQEQLLHDIAVRLPAVVNKVPTYANYLGSLLKAASVVSSLTRHEAGIMIPPGVDLTGFDCYADPDRVPYRIGCSAGYVNEYNVEGHVTRMCGVLSFSDADRDRLSAAILAALK